MTKTARNFLKGEKSLLARHRAETRFQWLGRIAIIFSLTFLILMVGSIAWEGKSALTTHKIALKINLNADVIDPSDIKNARYDTIIKSSLREMFPDVKKRKDKKALYNLVSPDAGFELREQIIENPNLLGQIQNIWITASDDVDIFMKDQIDPTLDENSRPLNNQQLLWIDTLLKENALESRFNIGFFTNGDSREPELAGILSALVGSFLSLSVCFILSFPIGILAAIYLEEFAPKNKFLSIVEININNLAAVPSIIFGLLGLSIFLNTFGLPRSTPLVGGMVLSLMTLPTIIIASRASLRAVPPSIREAALGIGASPIQSTFHHVAPLALPGMFTGAIVGMARALGDTAPLLMIGMVAFIVDIPKSFLEPATALPVQIFLWADSPERAFLEKVSAAIIVLLIFLILMNIIAIILRKKFELRF